MACKKDRHMLNTRIHPTTDNNIIIYVHGFLVAISACLVLLPPPTNGTVVPFESTVEPGNSVGIFTETITKVQRWAQSTKMLTEIKIKYLPDEGLKHFKDMCRKNMYARFSDSPGDEIQWGNCTLTPDWISMPETTGVPEYFGYNYTVKQVRIKPYKSTEDAKLCIIKGLERPKFFASVMSVVLASDSDDDLPIHKLDMIREKQMATFEGVIDPELVYQFDTTYDFINRPPLYNCILSLLTSAPVAEIKKHCPVMCGRRKVSGEHDEL